MPVSFAVIFDMDGVIVDSNPTHRIALRQFCARYGFELTESELTAKIYGRTNANWLRNLFGDLTAEQIQRYAREKEELFRNLYANQIRPLSGLREFLEHLRQAGVATAIGTSAPPENVEFVLRSTGLSFFF